MFIAGDKIGNYTLIQKLGRGAFGVVWLAERRTLVTKTKVAIKFPLDEDVDLDLFYQEAELWSLASGHPNVLPIIEADIIEDQLLIVSEYAENGSLEEWIDSKREFQSSLKESIKILIDILSGLEHLHSKGIIHRDLKPGNILFQGKIPRLADFGISRIYSSTTHSRGVAGTPIFMAPEAFDGKRNEQTDIWSVGVIFYQMLTGSYPFPDDEMGKLLKAVFFNSPAQLPSYVPKSICSIVFRALEKKSEDRYLSTSEMLDDLQRQEVVVDLLFANEEKNSTEKWDGGKRLQIRNKPRTHHYAVVHRVLRDDAFKFPATLVENLTGEKGEAYMKFKWLMHIGAEMTGNMHEPEDVPADEIECSSIQIGRNFKGALVKFPQPVGPTEAFYAAILIPKDAEPGDLCSCRFITLEFSPRRINGTILGEWNHEEYVNHGDGPPPTREAFLKAVESLI